MAKSKEFKTEVKELLDLVTHSLYTNKEIFLRELISNASDAIDRGCFEALSNKKIQQDEWKIEIVADKEGSTLTIIDNGIGMNEEDADKNIGTIASSGTSAFLEQLKSKGSEVTATELIGQFGVGFYSAFMVADKVVVTTRRAGDSPEKGIRWTSKGTGTYSVSEIKKEEQGTKVTLHLKEDMQDFLEEWRIRSVVKKYSDYIEYPIVMNVEKEEGEGDDKKTVVEEQTLNTMKAIWARSKTDVKDEDYNEFYKHISHDFVDPGEIIHYNVEGIIEFKSLLFIPSQVPFNFYMPTGNEKNSVLHLYVKRVFISDDCKDLLPDYLRFMSGVVDSSDIPLNVSRETLQENPLIKKISKNLVGKILNTLSEMKEKRTEDYLKFWNNFGRVLKEGVHFDFANKDKIQDLLLFESSFSADCAEDENALVSLDEYVKRMPESQTEIYYITGDSTEMVKTSPHLEIFKKKKIEVLFLTDPIDEWVVQSLTDYKEKPLKSITKGDIELDSEEDKKENEKKKETTNKKYKTLIDVISKILEEDIKEVRFSNRLTDSACCLVADEQAMNPNMERIFKAMKQDIPKTKRILELNSTHPIIDIMQNLCKEDKKSPKLNEYAELLYDQALLTEGSPLRNPLEFTKRVSELMVNSGK